MELERELQFLLVSPSLWIPCMLMESKLFVWSGVKVSIGEIFANGEYCIPLKLMHPSQSHNSINLQNRTNNKTFLWTKTTKTTLLFSLYFYFCFAFPSIFNSPHSPTFLEQIRHLTLFLYISFLFLFLGGTIKCNLSRNGINQHVGKMMG